MKEKHGEYIAIYWEDDCDIEYVRGHVTLAEARAALEFGCGKGCGDFAHSVTHRWARWQPAPRGSDFDSLFVARDDQARGCFAVTEVKLGKKMAPDDPREDVEVRGQASRLGLVPPHKRLFNAPADHGLPIGNLSSQFFANVLLNDLDQRIKHQHRAPHYVRYVDDFVLVHPSTTYLQAVLADVAAWLPAQLHLQLNPRKTVLQPVHRGITFVGQVIKPGRRTTKPATVAKAVARVRQVPGQDLRQIANSYFGLLGQASHSHHHRARLAAAVLQRGHAVNANLRKAYP